MFPVVFPFAVQGCAVMIRPDAGLSVVSRHVHRLPCAWTDSVYVRLIVQGVPVATTLSAEEAAGHVREEKNVRA